MATRPQQSLLCTNAGLARQVLVSQACSVCEKLYIYDISTLGMHITLHSKSVVLFIMGLGLHFLGAGDTRTREQDECNQGSV